MHFSIPDTEEFSDDSGSTYMGYNLHINGAFHCTLRYRQLHHLHELLKREYNTNALPYFPSKKILPLTPNQLEERRAQLEKYIQLVGQDSNIILSELFNGFLLCAQHETRKMFECRVVGSWEGGEEVDLEVFLMNGFRVPLRINSNECSSEVLEKVCRQIQLPSELIYYFSLFLIKREDDGHITILRKLQDFESPYISQKSMNCVSRIVLRKSYWDPAFDEDLIQDRVGLNLLYVQTVADVERGGWLMRDEGGSRSSGDDTRSLLASLQARGAKKEYLEAARRNLHRYGFVHFGPCVCDYPKPGTPAVVSIGPRELVLRITVQDEGGVGKTREGVFKVTRMKCWRITTLHNKREADMRADSPPSTSSSSSSSTPSSSSSSPTSGGQVGGEGRSNSMGIPQFELSFEYLLSKDRLQWVTVTSEQAILMSICLRDVVDELLLKRNGGSLGLGLNKSPIQSSLRLWGKGSEKSGKWSYMRLDGSVMTSGLPSRVHDNGKYVDGRTNRPTAVDMASASEGAGASKSSSSPSPSTPLSPPRFVTNTVSPPLVAPVENDAFEGIGDEDL
ncbi:sorting nexin-17 [Ischnura elegans]|uniref:sorting nexin-17 n=1 Tax=Ischnura elegans TaxID=197161 RepID=UPI001ED8AF32|nr:sorting nexin-17 [Ischnura elegans]